MQAARIAAFLFADGLAVSFVGAALAADDVPVMITDRPTISVSSRTVPRGYFQLETNVALNVDRIIQNRFDVGIFACGRRARGCRIRRNIRERGGWNRSDGVG